MRVLIYGGRDFSPTREAFYFLFDMWKFCVLSGQDWTAVITGRAKGADSFGETFARWLGVPVDSYPADWYTLGKAAGHIRNQQMLDSGVDLAIQFPGGRGTADMRRRLDKAGVTVREYHEAD